MDGVFLFGKAEVGTGEVERAFIQNTDNEFFAVNGGKGGDTEVVIGSVDDHADTPVLRDTALRNGDARKNFQPRADGG